MNAEQDYYARPELSNSDVSILAKPNGPQLFKAIKIDRTMKIEPTEAMNLGSMVHTLGLEPETFGSKYALMPEGLDRVRKAGKMAWRCFEENKNIHDLYVYQDEPINRRTKAGQAEYAIFEELAMGREIISRDDWNKAQSWIDELEATRGKKIVKADDIAKAERCVKALMHHEQIGTLLRTPAMIEKEVTFEWLGVLCRSKLDWCNLELGVILDIKTCQDASPRVVANTMADRGYYRQASFYRKAIVETTGIECRFLFACVDANEPHSVACYEPSEEMLTRGHAEIEAFLTEYQYRYESGDWMQEWSKGIVPIDLPKWAGVKT